MSRIGIVSLGCPKALVDSERIITQLRTDGYDVVSTYDAADLVVINTCGFIESAVEESLDAIGEAIAEHGKVIVTGCLGTKADAVRAAHPGVLAVTGPAAYEDVLRAVHAHLPAPAQYDPRIDLVPAAGIRLTPRHYAYLKISEGCNHRCSFCIIPQLRGDLVSRPIGDVLEEARRLVDSGVRELLVISQDTSAYGVDRRYKLDFWGGRPIKTRFYDLCAALGELGAWVRLHYVYPYPHVDDVIPLMRDGVVLPYLDIPFQHASPRILKAMRRPAATERVLERITAWREICPELTIRSTFIVGFPGETDDDFDALLTFLDDARIDRAGCFVYSPIDGAAANDLADPVEPWLAEERYERFMRLQAEVSREQLEAKVGRDEQILIDSVDDGVAWGRSRGDAPEIDGRVRIAEAAGLQQGQIVVARITDVLGDHDLEATRVP